MEGVKKRKRNSGGRSQKKKKYEEKRSRKHIKIIPLGGNAGTEWKEGQRKKKKKRERMGNLLTWRKKTSSPRNRGVQGKVP